jgi:hypothetical protein
MPSELKAMTIFFISFSLSATCACQINAFCHAAAGGGALIVRKYLEGTL